MDITCQREPIMRKALPKRTLFLFISLINILIVRSEETTAFAVDNKQEFSVEEEQRSGTFVGNISIIDGLEYRFFEESEYIKLNSKTGELRTSKIIDRESLDEDYIELFVQSIPPKHLIELRIHVKDINDNSPVFLQSPQTVFFSEDDRQYTQILLPTATDRDSGKNGVTTNYQIVNGNELNRFRLLTLLTDSKPLLYVENTQKLNREEQSEYVLNVSVADGGDVPRYGFLKVIVRVTDVNDQEPIFDQSDIVVSVNETIPPDSYLATVRATDQDEGENARITYSIQDDQHDQFRIDKDTGEIWSKKKLQCLISCQFSTDSNCFERSCVVTLIATDGGNPPFVNRAFLTVRLLDVNDNIPTIKVTYLPTNGDFGIIEESANASSTVAIVTVTDNDEGLNAQTSLKISSGNEKNQFSLKKVFDTYLIKVNATLDREKKDKYNLTLYAHDNGTPRLSSRFHAIFHIIDINDHKPVFEKTAYNAVLTENSPIGSSVVSATATDGDSGKNAELTYRILSGNDYKWFKIDPETGLITTAARMDYEKDNTIDLTIEARDKGNKPFSTTVSLQVRLLDVNDEYPIFSNNNITVTKSENIRVGSLIYEFRAEDRDSGKSGLVRYKFGKSTDLFNLDKSNGRLTLKKSLDREKVAIHRLKVVAYDQGQPSLSSTSSITIILSDENDHSPIFYPLKYFVTLRFCDSKARVTRLFANDKDNSTNGTIAFTIQPIDNRFRIDDNGVLWTNNGICQSGRIAVNVNARDGGGRQSERRATVFVYVSNVKIDPIVFTRETFSFTVDEDYDRNSNFPIRTIGRILLRDSIIGVEFQVVNGDDSGLFQIDRNGYLKSTNKGLNADQQKSFSLIVVASTRTSYGEVTVRVDLNDLNDNPPTFDQQESVVNLSEDAAVGHHVYKLGVTDKDITPVNSQITYSLQGSDRLGISSDGLLYVKKLLNYTPGKELNVKITASDGKHSREGTVKVLIVDSNDNNPEFEKAEYVLAISEKSQPNSVILEMKASDQDSGINARLNYVIESGNYENQFGLFPDGQLYVKKALDRELKADYKLIVRVNDNGQPDRSSTTVVKIHLIDENDNAPAFPKSIKFSVQENSPIYSFIGVLKATDPDEGRNAEITYSFEEKNESRFGIDPTKGVVWTRQVFDRESINTHIPIVVVAEDHATLDSRKSSSATIEIYVTDTNDNPPKFEKDFYKISLLESTEIDVSIFKLIATDPDADENGNVAYDILYGDRELFRIDAQSGGLFLNEQLDREKKDEYSLTIIAKDQSRTNPLNSTCNIRISVLDYNDHRPVFDKNSYSFSLKENIPVGSFVGQIRAIDKDIGVNGLVKYDLVRMDDNVFDLERESGRLYLSRHLDFELKTFYMLNISAYDNGNPRKTSFVACKISIINENDNQPKFPISSIIKTIDEGQDAGKFVAYATATDKDVGSNLKYSLVRQEPPGNDFNIDENTGRIVTKAILNREEIESYKLVVECQDGKDYRIEKSVVVLVGDVNDNPPAFRCWRTAIVNRRNSVGIKFFKATAIDPDLNADIAYELKKGSEYFEINRSDGTLSVLNSLNNAPLKITVRIRAFNPGSSQSVEEDFQVIVADSMTESFFSKSVYYGQLYENEMPKDIVKLTTTTEVDEFLAFGNDQRGVGQFDVIINDGRLRNTKELNREDSNLLNGILIEVAGVKYSSGKASVGKTKVRVTVLDRNDNAPKFEQYTYTVEIPEDAKIDYVVASLKAKDADSTSSIITYDLLNNADSKLFKIDEREGVIKLQRSIDFETKKEHKLTVTASDGSFSSSADVIIRVEDVNDLTPAFKSKIYSFDVAEHFEPVVRIGQVKADDGDSGVNGQITYSFITTYARDKFSMDGESGSISLIGNLDYEQTKLYILVVEARDNGRNVVLSSTASVFINVLDSNDNKPTFNQSTYSTTVKERSQIGQFVLNITATDVDEGENGAIKYSITDGNEQNCFQIGDNNGILKIADEIDRETISEFRLIITATDRTSPFYTSTAKVIIKVEDINDEPPLLTIDKELRVSENMPSNTLVDKLTFVDRDIGPHHVRFSLRNNGGGNFKIDPKMGNLLTTRKLDYKKADKYELLVRIEDANKPDLKSESKIIVRVKDENNYTPFFVKSSYSAEISEAADTGTTIISVKANDEDSGLNGQVRYYITEGDDASDFLLDSHSGSLTVRDRLDSERADFYNLRVVAKDMGERSKSSTVMLTVKVTSSFLDMPTIKNSPIRAKVLEGPSSASVDVVQVLASYTSGKPLEQVQFALQKGDLTLFGINEKTGLIYTKKELDSEEKDEYKLEVLIITGAPGKPTLTGTGIVEIHVEDANDNDPIFITDSYTADVIENAPGVTFITVQAVDKDFGKNGRITYSLSNYQREFQMNEVNGEISTRIGLDREEKAEYNLIVKAKDNGDIYRMSMATVLVRVRDFNDNTPKFSMGETFRVNAPLNADKPAASLSAYDEDLYENGTLQFSILDYNSNLFNCNSKTGLITAKRKIDTGEYQFKAIVEDAATVKRSTELIVKVIVRTPNTAVPDFSPNTKTSFSLREDEDIDKVFYTIKTTQSKGIFYRIIGGNLQNIFYLHRNTGELSLKCPLKSVQISKYQLLIEIFNENEGRNWRVFNINIQDVLNTPPMFDQLLYKRNFTETLVGEVLTVSATDRDSGLKAKLAYSIQSGNVDNKFSIDSEDGSLSVHRALDREKVSFYRLVIVATDNGQPKETGSCTVEINVQDVNDNYPRFTHNSRTTVSENVGIGSSIVRITASDPDLDKQLRYQLITNPSNTFDIDEITGIVTVVKPLDYLQYQSYFIRISVEDGVYQQTTTYQIKVEDTNNQSPKFKDDLYSFNVIENSKVGTFVGKVSATDADTSNLNSKVRYSFKTPTEIFWINKTTGEVFTRDEIVRNELVEEENNHELIVSAFDFGEPVLSGQAQLIISIKKKNTRPPTFEKSSYSTAVEIDANTGTVIFRVTATDQDVPIVYKKVNENIDTDRFHLNPSNGEITLASSVKDLINKIFVLKIEASDSGNPVLKSICDVSIEVVPPNENAPKFTGSSSFRVDEDKQRGFPFGLVSATDPDGTSVTFELEGTELFSISRSGNLIVLSDLDYEKNTSHTFNVIATDTDPVPLKSKRTITVFINDVNDNPPIVNPNQIIKVSELTSPNRIIHRLNFTDLDSESNSVTDFFLIGDSKALTMFNVNRTNGEVKTIKALDYEKETTYSLIFKATNPGTSLSSTSTVKLEVLSDNEYAPKFKNEEYNFIVSESAKPGHELGVVEATDNDKGLHGFINYYLVGDSNAKGFTIDHNTGKITISSSVDRESSATIKLIVIAKNPGPINEKLVDYCTVQVSVRDANDYPKFVQKIFQGRIMENVQPGAYVGKVTATDNDIRLLDRTFLYSLGIGDSESLFQIDSNDGTIRSRATFNRELTESYSIRVLAIDRGVPPMTGSATMIVTVEDTNDEPPYFDPEYPIGYVTENSVPGSEVVIDLKLFTKDKDLDPNRGPYIYELLDQKDKLNIDKGVVETRVNLNREELESFDATVKVQDSGSGQPQTSTLTFRVVVNDVNDNPSTERSATIIINVLDNEFDGGIIADVRPLDIDKVGNFQCSSLKSDSSDLTLFSNCSLVSAKTTNFKSLNIKVNGNDSIHGTVTSTFSINWKSVSNDAAEKSLIIQLATPADDFFSRNYVNFVRAVEDIVDKTGKLIILSARDANEEGTELTLAYQLTSGNYLSSVQFNNILRNNKRLLENRVGLVVKRTNADPCYDNPCKNSGECVSTMKVNKRKLVTIHSDRLEFTSPFIHYVTKCTCQKDFTGTWCETPINECGTNECSNGGVCYVRTNNGFRCECPPNWTGDRCQQDVNECRPKNPCMNGGQCLNSQGSYKCICSDGFTGSNCESSSNACSSSTCLNNGVCKYDQGKTTCSCPYGNGGSNCERASKGFDKLSFMEYTFTMAGQGNSISIELATTYSHGLLFFYPGNSDENLLEFVALEIIDGHVQFAFALGDGSVNKLMINKKVNDGNWYLITAVRDAKVGTLQVTRCMKNEKECRECLNEDQSCFTRKTSNGNFQNLSSKTGKIWIGGTSTLTSISPFKNHLKTHDFSGCIRSIIVDNVDLFKTAPKSSKNIRPTCGRKETVICKDDSCSKNGKCQDVWNDIRCDCNEGFSGSTCSAKSKPITFDKNTYLEYVQTDSYVRDKLFASQLLSRKKRATSNDGTVAIKFRTNEDGNLLYSKQDDNKWASLRIVNGNVRYENSNTIIVTLTKKVTDGEWHTVTVSFTDDISIKLSVDSESKTVNTRTSLVKLLDLNTVSTLLAAAENDKSRKGFRGCIESFLIDGEKTPFEGENERFKVTAIGEISSLNMNCEAVVETSSSSDDKTLIAVIVIVVCFVLLLAVLLIVFIYRRRLVKKRPASKKANGQTPKANDSGHSTHDSGYADHNGEIPTVDNRFEAENTVISRHIEAQLASCRYNEREVAARPPDIVEPELYGRNGQVNRAYTPAEESAERYDLDAASSIAPSEMDVVAHYKCYRNGPMKQQRYSTTPLSMPLRESPIGPPLNNLSRPSSRTSPLGMPAKRHIMPDSIRSTPLGALNTSVGERSKTVTPISSEASRKRRYNPINNTEFTHSDLAAVAPSVNTIDSSSDEANASSDSFTCSEVDDVGFRSSQITTKRPMTRLDEEIESDVTSGGEGVMPIYPQNTNYSASSWSTLFSNENPASKQTKLPPSALDWDLLNWGTNFENFVAVFSDLASLPEDLMANHRSRTPSNASSNRHRKRQPTPSPSERSNTSTTSRRASTISSRSTPRKSPTKCVYSPNISFDLSTHEEYV
ncbi:DgyrCDS3721 [Dimorphilus gyrociliatus]|uniref:DgyrCDS3721 n=1 Tax=Dimorphilus gyrociliatus TaxID=2664684 RepID=A0A7I8VE73_9ANNE|nr:DgyrCDS3721 [Dimorphilus gyrociliatus]